MKNKIINTYIILFILLVFSSTIYIYILNKKALPVIMTYASVQNKKMGIEVLRETGINEVNSLLKDKELYKIEKNSYGEIESVDFDTTVINESLVIIAKNVRKRLKEIEKGKNLPDDMADDLFDKKLKNGLVYKIPVGIMSGNVFLYDLGPKIPVKIKYLGNVGLDVKSEVKQYGINSALIQISVHVEVSQKTILPFRSKTTKLTSDIPVVIKLIKGDVPNYISGSSYSLPID